MAILSAAVFFHRFTLSLTGTTGMRRVLYPLYFSYVLFLALIPTDLVVRGMQTLWYGKAPVIGPLFFPFVLCVYTPIVLGLAALLRHQKQTRINDERTRDQYIIGGIVAMFIGGTTDYLPSLGINLYPLGIIGNLVFCLLATIAVLKYHLLEARVVLRKERPIP